MHKDIEKQIEAIERLKGKSTSVSAEFVSWRKETEEVLKEIFGANSAEVQEFNTIYYTPVFLTCRMGDEAFEEAYGKGLEDARALLLSLMDKIIRRG